ncbi:MULTISPECIES: calcium-translocating P-type ATPase, PMCA-type [Clostridium]|uniref:P-type Ca(2+) transporter n=1 Tax=Clostridium cadaveris TaxID=1529 RepID=A0A1I2JIU3_9CLOT|nr:calcium-translocating P-type ATPase, PMCA-type [Clostridium cadaveris]MDU4951278.1 calcium-translocating P-type ATPase, PMCA-type [Clostridium sp.]MDM8310721.1 calcium-translocating P-type ATPase, PMCA-type [Clostridium cadaveris]MDY4949499.1 calcium-translocating P-type ATPase, PMCA-type [Clostridium cadaveris]NME63878.1 calcium-translocating P-type ATPase, PMCA-type [Clostridium cadaveris]NWK10485.1 calcium-translocating P-type ATPase, PMCA-type [Clostridium cadaveris]
MVEEKDLIIGLTNEEADKRLKVYGLNTLQDKKKISPIFIFLAQFNDFMTWVLLAATVISGIMGDMADAITILIIVVINGLLGFVQEYRTEKSLEALKNLAAPTTKVYRNGKICVMSAEKITLGDVVVLEAGDRIPGDGIIIDGNGIMVNESLLTGESDGVEKNLRGNNKIFMGTIVLKGKALAKITEVGMSTEMGKIADMLSNIEEEKSPLKEKLNRVGRVLVVVCMAICAVVTLVGIARGQEPREMFLLGVSLAVAAIPEGLPAIVTVSLALGVSRMLKRNALVRKLPAVETLGCTSIICSDKTGTLTENKMTVKAMYFNNNIYESDKISLPENILLKKAFTYCNDCNYDFESRSMEKGLMGDPTETALISAYFKNMKDIKIFLNGAQRIYELPFDSSRKMMSVVVKENGKEVCYVKGAPEKLIGKCKYILLNNSVVPFDYTLKNKVSKSIEEMSLKALRCIGAAYKDSGITKNESLEKDLIFLGIAGIIDPPRKEVKDSILKCRMAGIRPVMITGDHKNTAFAIGKEIDLCTSLDEVMTGEEIESISDKDLIKKVMKTKIYARVSPNHKLRIVKAYKSIGKVVAMTGDGVNDAPAIKEADIGIAMGISGTDVSKEASAMILMDDNFSTIVSAVEEGRVIYNNIRKFIRYLLSCNLGEVLTMFLASMFSLPIPLSPIQILFVNLATDGLPAIALGVDPPDSDIMGEKPRKKNEDIFARGLVEKIVIRGALIGICTLLTFIAGMYYGFSIKTCRTMTLSTLVLSQLIHVFECRSERHSIFEIKLFTNPYLVGAVLVSIVMLLSIIYIPFLSIVFQTTMLNIGQWFIVVFFSGIIAMINSLYLYRKR